MKNGNYEYKLLYSGQLSPIARLNDEDRVVEEYVYGSRVNVPEYMIKDGRKYRFLTDHRGSVRMVVDTHDGNIMQRTDYDEFGLIIDEDLAENWTPVLFGYAGGLQDRDTGLIRFGARDYDPMVGRWTSKEPLGFNGSSNFYVYAENDPVNFVDVTGLYSMFEFGEDALHFLAGLGNAVSFGLSSSIAEQFLDSHQIEVLKNAQLCSNTFKAGEWASLILGLGRLAYAGVAKGASMTYAAKGYTINNAMAASTFRNTLKKVFRLNPFSEFRVYPFSTVLSKYNGSAQKVIEAAGRTNSTLNWLGAVSAGGGATTLAKE
jgi:RHS repeat-associated protein